MINNAGFLLGCIGWHCSFLLFCHHPHSFSFSFFLYGVNRLLLSLEGPWLRKGGRVAGAAGRSQRQAWGMCRPARGLPSTKPFRQ